ncbi:hypothetical protein B0H13DRAFT_2273681 [Mycena leptocephala]|nr:hypothetical protein B0H13DRAFT_2273681 [Mycena leptocephala]
MSLYLCLGDHPWPDNLAAQQRTNGMMGKELGGAQMGDVAIWMGARGVAARVVVPWYPDNVVRIQLEGGAFLFRTWPSSIISQPASPHMVCGAPGSESIPLVNVNLASRRAADCGVCDVVEGGVIGPCHHFFIIDCDLFASQLSLAPTGFSEFILPSTFRPRRTEFNIYMIYDIQMINSEFLESQEDPESREKSSKLRLELAIFGDAYSVLEPEISSFCGMFLRGKKEEPEEKSPWSPHVLGADRTLVSLIHASMGLGLGRCYPEPGFDSCGRRLSQFWLQSMRVIAVKGVHCDCTSPRQEPKKERKKEKSKVNTPYPDHYLPKVGWNPNGLTVRESRDLVDRVQSLWERKQRHVDATRPKIERTSAESRESNATTLNEEIGQAKESTWAGTSIGHSERPHTKWVACRYLGVWMDIPFELRRNHMVRSVGYIIGNFNVMCGKYRKTEPVGNSTIGR